VKLALFGVAASNGSIDDLPRNRVRRGDVGKQISDAGDILD